MQSNELTIKAKQIEAAENVKKQGTRVLVCAGTGCVANGSLEVIKRLREAGVDVQTIQSQKMTVVPTGCHGFCEQGALMIIPDLHMYQLL